MNVCVHPKTYTLTLVAASCTTARNRQQPRCPSKAGRSTRRCVRATEHHVASGRAWTHTATSAAMPREESQSRKAACCGIPLCTTVAMTTRQRWRADQWLPGRGAGGRGRSASKEAPPKGCPRCQREYLRLRRIVASTLVVRRQWGFAGFCSWG